GLDNAGLVGILDRHEDRPRLWQARAAAELALDESDVVVAIDTHHFAGRFHFRPEHRIDRGAEAREREHGFLDADMPGGAGLEALRLELKARQGFACHDARRE